MSVRVFGVMVSLVLCAAAIFLPLETSAAAPDGVKPIDFNRDIRPILSNNCFHCHGPDENERKADLRLDTYEGATENLGGTVALKPKNTHESELYQRVVSTEASKLMPPAKSGKKLSDHERDLLKRWINEGGSYATHWAYVAPKRPTVPSGINGVDHFVLARLKSDNRSFSPRADRATLARRLSLDLIGLPPSPKEVAAFVADTSPKEYEAYVDRLLNNPAYGEHFARPWLDLARYADSAGYADDPARTIWAYRDYVIRSLNANKPFDQFTIEQLAGDLLPNPTDEQLIATAFHRNTLTNNEGGTSDEEFRSVAIVDRVNTTLTTWMGTSIACAQCHTHKYDPITQTEYFQLYAFLNNTADADRRDESPLHSFYSADQSAERTRLTAAKELVELKLRTPTPAILAAQAAWERELQTPVVWDAAKPTSVKSQSKLATTIRDDGSIFIGQTSEKDTQTVMLPLAGKSIQGLRISALPDPALPGNGPGHANGNFVLNHVSANILPPAANIVSGRYVRLELPGKGVYLMLAEVEVLQNGTNVAPKGTASQISTGFDGPAKLANDGNTSGEYFTGKSVAHTALADNPWWELDLGTPTTIDQLRIWNRTDGGIGTRNAGLKMSILDAERKPIWTSIIEKAPAPSATLMPSNVRPLAFDFANASFEQSSFPAASLLASKTKTTGWAIAGGTGKPQQLELIAKVPIDVPAGSQLQLMLEQSSNSKKHTLGHFRIETTSDSRAATYAQLPTPVRDALREPAAKRSPQQRATLQEFYVKTISTEFQAERQELAELDRKIANLKPVTVPIFKELVGNARRKTHLQHRGNYQDLGDEVSEGVPSVFPALPKSEPKNRLALAKWLVSEANPLTARVIANRYWEQLFGIGLVRTSEEFGSQGELPSHPELLDWLATELHRTKWDIKAFIKLLVMSEAYQQQSNVSQTLLDYDPENLYYARGPRLRLTAEMVRDQALKVSGLLSGKMYGPSVKPPQPSFGLSAAFGGSMDWTTSEGSDKYRRGIYTEWRRTNPYPSMATFDAPNRDICSVRRPQTNTPLQALVTMNDSVYIEAAQALARRIIAEGGATFPDRLNFVYQECLNRNPTAAERTRLETLFQTTLATYIKHLDRAAKMATEPIGTAPRGANLPELATWTILCNVLLNLDEMMMKR